MKLPKLAPWTVVDVLWYDYRDPWAEGVPGAEERLLALRTDGGWSVPFKVGVVFIADGVSKDADAALSQLRESGLLK